GGSWRELQAPGGGRGERVEARAQRRTGRTEHHELLGSMFLTPPPACRFRVDVRDAQHPVTKGLAASFEVEDEPYFIELRNIASAQILLTADSGATGRWPMVEKRYGPHAPPHPAGKTRAIG